MRLINADKLIEYKFKNPISYAAFCNLVKRQMTVDVVPCDVCRFAPPSSGDGKPCTMCPAAGKDG